MYELVQLNIQAILGYKYVTVYSMIDNWPITVDDWFADKALSCVLWILKKINSIFKFNYLFIFGIGLFPYNPQVVVFTRQP